MTALERGTVLGPQRVGPISRADLALFAVASGDLNPIHIDLDVARSAGLDDVFAHGMLSMAHLGRLLTDHVPQGRLRDFQVRFLSVTPVNAELSCRGTVRTIDSSSGSPIATVDVDVVLGDGTPTLSGTATVDLG